MPLNEVRTCIYCDEEKPESEFSLEHIFPDSLGGNLCSDLFKSHEVCRRCNSISGVFVDGAFIRNWFVKNEALAVRQYLDVNSPTSVLPLVYMGRLKNITLDSGYVCEVWLGEYGAKAYHFHQEDEARFDTYAGGDPIKRHSDAGRAYIALTSQTPFWYQLAVRSFVAAFHRADRYAVNFVPPMMLHPRIAYGNVMRPPRRT